jgi:hypothetical protein
MTDFAELYHLEAGARRGDGVNRHDPPPLGMSEWARGLAASLSGQTFDPAFGLVAQLGVRTEKPSYFAFRVAHVCAFNGGEQVANGIARKLCK